MQILSERGLNQNIEVRVEDEKIAAIDDSEMMQQADSLIATGLKEIKAEPYESFDFCVFNGKSIYEYGCRV